MVDTNQFLVSNKDIEKHNPVNYPKRTVCIFGLKNLAKANIYFIIRYPININIFHKFLFHLDVI